jgi:hypothetical protein
MYINIYFRSYMLMDITNPDTMMLEGNKKFAQSKKVKSVIIFLYMHVRYYYN